MLVKDYIDVAEKINGMEANRKYDYLERFYVQGLGGFQANFAGLLILNINLKDSQEI